MTSQPASRYVVVALSPAGPEDYVITWLLENFLRPGRDKVDIVCALTLDTGLDAEELGTTSFYMSSWICDLDQQIESEAKENMEQYAKRLRDANIPTVVHVIGSRMDSGNMIVEYVEKCVKSDVLVMGSHLKGSWNRLFWGSFSSYVQKKARCTVITVRDSVHEKVDKDT
ncbi:uncharacterized protein VTP21DRAFT_4190 [Calcarisporiella thermophila]|uniref:uncharacterized protein n=1 Tax=Calcarisporiella thermophila TaxID=911321 RepID=UPI0037445B80